MKLCRVFALAALLGPALTLFATEVGRPTAAVLSREVVDEGRTVKAKVRFAKAGTYYVAGGYVVDRDAKFLFLESKLTGTRYFAVRKVETARDNAVVELTFSLKAVPPLLKEKKDHVSVFLKPEHIPTTAP